MKGNRGAGIAALVMTTALWGVSFPLVEVAVAGVSHAQILFFLFLRFGLASLLFLPMTRVLVRSSKGLGLRPWLLAFCIGVLFFVGFYLQTWALQHTDASRSAFITVLSVPMVPFMMAMLQRRAPSRVHVIGSMLAIFGIGLLLAPEGDLAPNFGDWLTLASAFIFAIEIILLSYVTRRAPVSIIAFAQIASVALITGCVLPFVNLELPEEWPGLFEGVVITGIFCTTLALGGMTWGQARVRAETAAVIFALEPVFTVIFVWFLMDRGMSSLQALGGLIVFGAVVYSSLPRVESGT
ncbi:MAG: drug/metabolite transporter (DMT)-like permease [Planctomycetota bacterium]|jgi:drug/metabolite transporter (DMT)-like permease